MSKKFTIALVFIVLTSIFAGGIPLASAAEAPDNTTEEWVWTDQTRMRYVEYDADTDDVFASGDGGVHRIDNDTGNTVWSYTSGFDPNSNSDRVNSIAVLDNYVAFGAYGDGSTYILHKSNGSLHTEISAPTFYGRWTTARSGHGEFFVHENDDTIYRYDVDGNQLGTISASTYTIMSNYHNENNDLYFSTGGGEIRVYDLDSGTNGLLYSTDTSTPRISLNEYHGYVAISDRRDSQEYVKSIDAETGSLNFETPINHDIHEISTNTYRKEIWASETGSGSDIHIVDSETGSFDWSFTDLSYDPSYVDFKESAGIAFFSQYDSYVRSYDIGEGGSPPKTVSGTVTDTESGSEISGVDVTVTNESGGTIATDTTDSNGSYSVSVEPGTYTFTYEHDQYLVSKWENISVNDDMTLDMSLGRLYIEGTVTDKTNGGGLSGVDIEIYDSSNTLYNSTTTDSNGEYSVWVEDGSYTIYANHSDYINQNENVNLQDETQSYTANFELKEKPEEYLVLVVRGFIEGNETIPYRVEYVKNGNVERVTQQATITVDNESVVSIDRENQTLTGMNVNDTTTIHAEYQGDIEKVSDSANVTNAKVELKHIDLLPFSKKIEALLWDTTVQVIFLATFAGLGMSRIMKSGGFGAGRGNDTNPWIILGTTFMIVLLAGVRGYVSNGIIFSAFFYVVLASLLLKGTQKDNITVINEGGNDGFQ